MFQQYVGIVIIFNSKHWSYFRAVLSVVKSLLTSHGTQIPWQVRGVKDQMVLGLNIPLENPSWVACKADQGLKFQISSFQYT